MVNSCPACQKNEFLELGTIFGLLGHIDACPKDISFYCCASCGLVEANQDIFESYSHDATLFDEYYRLKGGSFDFTAFFKFAASELDGKEPLNILEVGARDDSFAKAFCSNFELKKFCYEMYDPGLPEEKKDGSFVYKKAFFDSRIEKKYDYIFALNTAEHVTDLSKFLLLLKNSLKAGGKIFLEVPSFDIDILKESEEDLYDEKLGFFLSNVIADLHLLYFSKENIELVFASCGLKIEKVMSKEMIFLCLALDSSPSFTSPDIDKVVGSFKKLVSLYKSMYRELASLPEEKKLLFYGLSSQLIVFLNLIGNARDIEIIDDGFAGHSFGKQKIKSLDEANLNGGVVLLSPFYEKHRIKMKEKLSSAARETNFEIFDIWEMMRAEYEGGPC